MITATYSPEDNKIRIYPAFRLDAETYARVKAAGFTWAPKQECFIAGMWTPEREDLARALADDGIIDAEESTREERAAMRAERFEGYSERRAQDSAAAHAAVRRLADGIPLGQPILVGHHSQARAERDAKRIEQGMRRAVDAWETSRYWIGRAHASRAHADYVSRPDVRFRRIKTLEADRRRAAKNIDDSRRFAEAWRIVGAMTEGPIREAGARIANHEFIRFRIEGETISAWSALTDCKIDPHEAARRAMDIHAARIAHYERWAAHYANRIAYEQAMLEEQAGGRPDEKWQDIEPGGMVLCGRDWLTVVRVTRKDGRLVSVSTNARYGRIKGAEEITDYRPPEEGAAEKVKAATALGPLVNERADGCIEMTSEEWKRHERCGNGHAKKFAPTEEHDRHRRRIVYRGGRLAEVFLTDAPVKARPPRKAEPAPLVRDLPIEPGARLAHTPRPDTTPPEIAALKASLAAGVTTVSAPQLFPTPDALADEVIALAGIEPNHRVLEPSAGTGQLWNRIPPCWKKIAVELSATLASRLSHEGDCADVITGDFLSFHAARLGEYDRIVMNPPFSDGADIKHISHALTMLRPGGRLVAICADGPRQNSALRPFAKYWRSLPSGTFAGTGVRSALLVIEKESEP